MLEIIEPSEYRVEIVPQAIDDAKQNAKLNNMTNTEFFVGAAEAVVPKQYEKSCGKRSADVVTLDPPRKGCDERLLDTVVKMAPSRIVYVSCDPGTLARDVKVLADRGYEVKRVRACDMFGGSFHVETVCLLSKKPCVYAGWRAFSAIHIMIGLAKHPILSAMFFARTSPFSIFSRGNTIFLLELPNKITYIIKSTIH